MHDKKFDKFMKELTYTQIKTLLKRNGYIDALWSLEDIEYQAKEDKVCLTEQEIKDVANWLARKHDACVGINWDVISYWIEYVIEQRGT